MQKSFPEGGLARRLVAMLRDGKLAIGMVLGIALYLLIGFGLDYTNPPIESNSQFVASQEDSSDNRSQSDKNPGWGLWKWTGHFIESGDTLAQWMMMIFTVVAAALLLATLAVTRRMARETKVVGDRQVEVSTAAVNAARDANEVAVKQFMMGVKPQLTLNLNGPYVDESRFSLTIFAPGETPRWTCIEISAVVENMGNTPATITSFFIGCVDGEGFEISGWREQEVFALLPPGRQISLNQNLEYNGGLSMIPETVDVETPDFRHLDLAHAGGFHLTADNREDFMGNRPKVYGWFKYSDQLNINRQMGFGLEPVGWGGQVKRWGGDEYNYDREIN